MTKARGATAQHRDKEMFRAVNLTHNKYITTLQNLVIKQRAVIHRRLHGLLEDIFPKRTFLPFILSRFPSIADSRSLGVTSCWWALKPRSILYHVNVNVDSHKCLNIWLSLPSHITNRTSFLLPPASGHAFLSNLLNGIFTNFHFFSLSFSTVLTFSVYKPYTFVLILSAT